MDQQQHQRMNEATGQFAGALTESVRTISERGASAQERGAHLAEDFLNGMINNLRTQVEQNRQVTQQLADQQQRQQEAAQTLTQESVDAYMDFVNSMFSFYQGGVKQAQRSTGEAAEGGGREELRNIVRESVQRSEGGS